MAKVTTTFTSDDKEVVASIDKMNKKLAELEEKNKRLAAEKQAQQEQENSLWNKTLNGATRAIAAYATMEAGIRLVNNELRARIELEDKIAGKQLSAAGGEREFLMNLGLVKGSDQKAAISRLQQISKSSGVAMTELYGPAGASLSASGGNVDVAFDAIERAAKIAPHSAQTMQLIAGAMIDLGKASGDFDNTKGLDLLVKIGEIARAPDWSKIATNAPRAIAGTSAMGFTPEESTALLATLSNQMADKDLAVSGTASMTLASRLRKFFPEHDITDRRGRVTTRGVGAMTGAERFAMIEGNEDLRRKFFNSLEESEAKPFIEQIVTPGTMLNKMYKQNLGDVQGMQRGEMGGFASALNTTPLQQIANDSRTMEAQIESELLGASEAGRFSVIRRKVDEKLEAAGFGSTDRAMAGWNMWGRKLTGASPEEMGIGMLEDAISTSRDRQSRLEMIGMGASPEEHNSTLRSLNDMVSILRRMETNQRAGNAANHTEGR